MTQKDESDSNPVDWSVYRDDPVGFARDILGSTWWKAQEDIAGLLKSHRRVAVKAANGVGKTYMAADLTLWFLYTHRPSVVLTTAPTWRQVESLLWEEIRRRHRKANILAELDKSRVKLDGTLLQTKLKIAEGHFAMGLSTDEPVRFQGFHAENLLIVLDEACGIPEEIWDAVEGICVGQNNRVLAISNPLSPTGRFYSLFQSGRWANYTISALMHPNVIARKEAKSGRLLTSIPGAVTREAVEDRIAEWCEEQGVGCRVSGVGEEEKEGVGCRVLGVGEENVGVGQQETLQLLGAGGLVALTPPLLGAGGHGTENSFEWQGRWYSPNPLFCARVLGVFPSAGDDSLFARQWLEEAQSSGREVALGEIRDGRCILAVDVARFGGDETVLALRRDKRVIKIVALRGLDTMAVAGRVQQMAIEERADQVAVDAVGVGAGVVDRLNELGLPGLNDINFGKSPRGSREAELFLNLRAQAFWGLRERFRQGEIAIPPDKVLVEQLASLKYHYSSNGRIQIESKDDMRRRGLPSPDRADALALLFCPTLEQAIWTPFEITRLPISRHSDENLARNIAWNEVGIW